MNMVVDAVDMVIGMVGDLLMPVIDVMDVRITNLPTRQFVFEL